MDAYRKLIAWQRCHALSVAVYNTTRAFPSPERFGLTAQLRRAAVSAAVNIAEGYARRGRGEFKHFLGISVGSLAEVDALLLIARDADLLPQEGYDSLAEMRITASKTVFGLLNAQRRPPVR